MRKKKASANVWIDYRRVNKNGLYPVLIRVCYLGKQWAVSLRIVCSKADYGKAMGEGRLSEKQRQLRGELNSHRTKAQGILDNMEVITPHTFKQQFFSEVNIQTASMQIDLETQFKAYIQEMKEDDRYSTAVWYSCAMRSYISFRGNCNLQDINVDYLKKYNVWMTRKGCSASTILCYMQKLRTVFNVAITKGILSQKYYPFGKGGYTLGQSTQSKKALYPQEVEKLWNYKPVTDAQREAKDFWFFCYLSNGCNPIDALKLRWKDISMANSTITFIRSKTKNTVKNVRPILVHMHDECRKVIEKHMIDDRKPSDFIFPVLKAATNEEEMLTLLCDWKRHVNRCLNRIGKTLKFEQPLILSVARHSFATALNLNGTPISFISEAMGHTNMKTTNIYLSTIPSAMKKDISAKLLDFGTTQLRAV